MDTMGTVMGMYKVGLVAVVIASLLTGCTMTNCTVTVDVTVLGSRSRNCETYGDDARIRAEVDGGGANSNSATVPLAH